MAAVAEREFPAIAVSLSAKVVPELREYERATTTLANAFVQARPTQLSIVITAPQFCTI